MKIIALTFAASLAFLAGTSQAAELPKDANTTCPVMTAEAADPDHFVDYQGKRIYLCCGKCKREFNKDPKKYMDRIGKSVKDTTSTITDPVK